MQDSGFLCGIRFVCKASQLTTAMEAGMAGSVWEVDRLLPSGRSSCTNGMVVD